ncbi:MAG: alpha-L-fucosidase [Ignavibacteriales bacterium]|nr:alpha-L-fucosidase [Ignavibacteriales bacterium]
MKIAFYCLIGLTCMTLPLLAQEREENYVREKDPLVLAKLEQWQDYKLGLLMTWGTYSQWGIVESWSLCGEDEGWCERRGPYANDYAAYKKAYENLRTTFNPLKFDPQRWAEAASEAGMRYVIFTTKHHDGFCMFETKTTDYKITSPEGAFHTNPKANVAKEIFDAFRSKGLAAGVYYSKPDWHSPEYWWPYFPTPDRHVNYDPAKYPDRWKRFKDYTYTQLEELMTGYGPIDILWFDGAWVRPLNNMPKEFESWGKKNNWDQDIDMGRITKMAHQHQPGVLVVDRWVNGQYENYLTPENKVPEKALSVPWESCITMATSWSYVKTDRYKSVRELVQLLVDVVAKGGNLLLNIGPSPEGEWSPDAYDRLKGMAAWMKVNSEAIYGTRAIAPFKEGKVCLTKKRDGGAAYAIYLPDSKEDRPPRTIALKGFQPAPGAEVTMLGVLGALRWKLEGKGVVIEIPDRVQQTPPCDHAWVIKVSKAM